jgi:hypothetical protein
VRLQRVVRIRQGWQGVRVLWISAHVFLLEMSGKL